MIYHFKTKAIKKKEILEKDFYLTADNLKAFYRRASDQYRLSSDDIEILEEIPDENIDISTDRFKRKDIEPEVKVENEYLIKAKELLDGDISGINEKKAIERTKNGWIYHDLIYPEEELTEYLSKYKTVKLYYLKTGAKKNKKYIVLCK